MVEARPAVVHVDRASLPASDRGDETPQDSVVQILFVDGADRSLHVDVRALEHELVQPRSDGELGMVVAVHEPRHHEVVPRAEDPVEGSMGLELGPWSRFHDRGAVDDEGAILDERLRSERDHRVSDDERACHLFDPLRVLADRRDDHPIEHSAERVVRLTQTKCMHCIACRASDLLVGLVPGEPLVDRGAAGEIEPGGARRERRFLVDLQI